MVLEIELEPLSPNELIYLLNIALIVYIINLKAQPQILIVEYLDIGLWVIVEVLHHPQVVD